eukprot:Protomagalhaensia_sp_Gyna_25__2682@NODE_2533_length_1030_cov_6_267407_g2101_i0_p1_GENE_NODE_2533_length_1030_cov_6_267407_g2101_i0NODE_2533_length_1030_cov_6_267407_g2101_i0_p1_ORF_typecomplete_len211_score17_20FHA/PF00498_26/7_5e03FHA/PF00498_26/4_8e07FHA_2/PF17913_1/0_0053_NODE_2533_length_1030_cov_6_267407_g2101_i037669
MLPSSDGLHSPHPVEMVYPSAIVQTLASVSSSASSSPDVVVPQSGQVTPALGSRRPGGCDSGFAQLVGSVGEKSFDCVIRTLLCVVGREAGSDGAEKQYNGYHCRELVKNEWVCVSLFRPSGLEPFDTLSWHPFDFTRIGFGAFKKLSRTHFSISWHSSERRWSVICLSGNGININDTHKLGQNDNLDLSDGDTITAANNTVKLAFHPGT